MPLRMAPSLCGSCVYKDPDEPKCEAFPDGIPISILSGYQDHFQSYRGDRGITFEPMEGTEEAVATFITFWYSIKEREE